MKIYLASSWRNPVQISILALLRAAGHEVYDFRNPEPGNHGFAWSEIDPNWLKWTPEQFRTALAHPLSVSGFNLDMTALKWCEACVLVLPCGRSAHLELGYACGAGKFTVAHLWKPEEPELMYRMLDAVTTTSAELLDVLWMKGGASVSPPAAPLTTLKQFDAALSQVKGGAS